MLQNDKVYDRQIIRIQYTCIFKSQQNKPLAPELNDYNILHRKSLRKFRFFVRTL